MADGDSLVEADGASGLRGWRCRHLTQKRLLVAVLTVCLAISVALALLYWPASPFRERFVSYQYAVTIDTDASDQYAVVCSLPADSQGVVYPDVVSLMSVSGDVVVSESSTPYGEGLEVIGTGSAVMTWSFCYHYRTSTESVLDHYSNLSMLDFGYYLTDGRAFVRLDGADVNISLAYSYSHVYGSVGADHLNYHIAGDLLDGWNEFPVDLDWTVS